MKTYYASPERKNKEIIIKDYNIINSLEIIKELINSLPYVVGILNSDRQLIFSNTMLTDLLGISKIDEILGKRPGEFLNCINASKEPGGCGVAENCSVCGAVRTICESQKTGKKISNECRLTAIADDKKNYFDLMITAMPLTVQNQKYTIVSITDISAEKRKLNLERIFFHDIVNTAGGLKGFIEFMKTSADPQQTQELLEISNKICDNLIEHILSQKELNAAERGELTVNYVKCNSKKILEDCVQQMKYHNVAKNKNIVINHSNCDIDFDTDVTMLKRIIGNMIKNGLEAS
ncbi:HAMP domain-containing histidine kinase, partial [Candidatus Dependentiae bacterium]|nr:HAMP domain-containing histidine kinase [Candidatus Dependentiae bacterium]